MSTRNRLSAALVPLLLVTAACSGSTEPPGPMIVNGPASSAVPSSVPAASSCPNSPVTVAVGATFTLPVGCDTAVLLLPPRWMVQVGSGGDTTCEIGIDLPDGKVRSVYGPSTLVHGRTAGRYTLSKKRRCTVTTVGADDDVRALPLELTSTSRSGATPMFDAPSGLRAHITGDAQKCNATVFRDSGQKLTRATPAKDYVAPPGRYFLETEVDGCFLTITAAGQPVG